MEACIMTSKFQLKYHFRKLIGVFHFLSLSLIDEDISCWILVVFDCAKIQFTLSFVL